VRILNFFILFISDDFWLVFVWLGLLVPPIKKMGEILCYVRDFPGHTVTFGSQLGKR
jgi:hypothetical protein